MSVFKDIQIALDTKLASLSGGVAVAWESTGYTPVRGTPFIRPTLLMGPSVLLKLEGGQINGGVYQLDVFYPTDTGNGTILQKIDDIYNHFTSTTSLSAGSAVVRIKEISRNGPVTRQDGWLVASIDISFKCYDD